MGPFRQGVRQAITTSASSAQSSAFSSQTYAILLTAATNGAWVAIGENPTAVANTDTFIPVNFPIYFQVTPGQKIAAVQNGGAGILSITELTK